MKDVEIDLLEPLRNLKNDLLKIMFYIFSIWYLGFILLPWVFGLPLLLIPLTLPILILGWWGVGTLVIRIIKIIGFWISLLVCSIFMRDPK